MGTEKNRRENRQEGSYGVYTDLTVVSLVRFFSSFVVVLPSKKNRNFR